ncbi:hypothetical protein MKOR_12290 [Mycolicibacillus koreensis]|nr:hypothetical protein MKOR_12290 [Mycolicibacillus koreensis]
MRELSAGDRVMFTMRGAMCRGTVTEVRDAVPETDRVVWATAHNPHAIVAVDRGGSIIAELSVLEKAVG